MYRIYLARGSVSATADTLAAALDIGRKLAVAMAADRFQVVTDGSGAVIAVETEMNGLKVAVNADEITVLVPR